MHTMQYLKVTYASIRVFICFKALDIFFPLKKLILIFHLVDHYCGCLSITFSNYRSYYLFLLLFITLLGNIKQTISMWVPLSLWKMNPKVLEKTSSQDFYRTKRAVCLHLKIIFKSQDQKILFLIDFKNRPWEKIVYSACISFLTRQVFKKKRNFYY